MTEINIDNPLYTNAFNLEIWKNQDRINFLKKNINAIENVVKKYLEGITDDFPQLTDHSLNHSKMLWNYANIIIGNKPNFINPLEAFVLHIAFLIHDSGMCYSILNNKSEIESDNIYLDYISKYGETEENKNEALFYTVRNRHGNFALRVATEKLREDEFLIADIGLREELGIIIGKIAKSHTCNINYIEREFGQNYCSPNFPVDWSINCQKISFILRTADAAHLDNLRTPKTKKMISEIEGVSKEHWTFQKKIGFPVISEDNLLTYNTNSPFNVAEQKAWWFCLDALEVLDNELKNANEYFDINRMESFTAKGVKSINDPLKLGNEYIRTTGWKSIDTKIKVSNPVHIASELGGVKLYGNINIALRELVQNSIDAINLHRVHTKQDNVNLGEIKISLEQINDDIHLIVSDNGIGMSQTLMTNELLDFGGSYWKSTRFNFDYEGLVSKGFESIGKFGIGFFSIFMLGKQLTVTSWKYGEGIENMKTLDFYDGLYSNPILREPHAEEKLRIIDRGTTISVKLDVDPYSKEGFIGNSQFKENTLNSLVKFLVPSANVRITTKELDGFNSVLEPNHLSALSYSELMQHVFQPKSNNNIDGVYNLIKQLDLELIEIRDNNTELGKLALLPQIGNVGLPSFAPVLSNGIRVNEVPGFAGYVITDDVVSIKRDAFSKLIPYASMNVWAIKQKSIIEEKKLQSLYNLSYIGLLMTFNLFDESLPIAIRKIDNNYSFITISEFRDYLKSNSQVKIHREGHTISGRKATCDGFISLDPRFNVNNIIKDEDLPQLVQYKSLVEKIIEEEWGNFLYEEDNLLQKGGYHFDMPYMFIENYERK